jgi:HlyD family secretion protein
MNDTHGNHTLESLGLTEPRPHRRRIWWVLAALALIALAAFAFFRPGGSSAPDAARFTIEQITRGSLSVKVTATGRLEPVGQVDVGSELSGTVASVLVTHNQTVRKGQTLARLDTSTLKAQVVQAEAALTSAEAGVREARATLMEREAEHARLTEAWRLSEGMALSARDLDASAAGVTRAEAAVSTAEAQVAEAGARLAVSRTSLSKAEIRTPIDGVVLNRAVEPGQTVAASLQAPVLFTIAGSLTEMELHVFVDEADVGQVRQGQQASFTVDAYPGRAYSALITEVRYTPTEAAGVITYETVLLVDNADLSLRPGMTATTEITTLALTDVLLVPNAALRFSPPRTEEDSRTFMEKLIPRRPRRSNQNGGNGPTVWVRNTAPGGTPLKAIPLKLGPTDGSLTVVESGEVQAGTPVAVGLAPGKE